MARPPSRAKWICGLLKLGRGSPLRLAKDKGCLGNLSCAELPDSLDVSWAQVKYFDFQLSTSMATFPHLVLLHAVFSLTTWDGSNGAELQERFLNISFVPPSPNLFAAVGACQGGRCFYHKVESIMVIADG